MDDRPISWRGNSFKTLSAMPGEIRRSFGFALRQVQNGLRPPDAKALKGFTPATVELLEDHDGDTYRAVYTAHYADIIYVIHCFQKKSTRGISLPKSDKETIEKRLAEVRLIEMDKARARKKGR
jgi:phage-related protein